jgi:hypothetical protein
MSSRFDGGVNIAVKIPKARYEETVKFYKEILRLEVDEQPIEHRTISRTHKVKFGGNILWLDCVDNYTHVETWLELKTGDVGDAMSYLKSKGVNPCDELEDLPDNAHWIMDPAGTVFIVSQ